MEALHELVARAKGGDADAFALMVRRFQDMAVGYGYAMLHDFHLAEDAAQEAFFEAYRTLSQLREPAAFAGWFRRIVFKQCDRIRRRHVVETVPLETDPEIVSGFIRTAGDQERTAQVLDAMRLLPEQERSTMTLFYIGGYSMAEVAAFLEVPVSTIKGRLHAARGRLRAMLVETVADDLRTRRPSRDERFADAVVDLLTAARTGDVDRVKTLLTADPRLLVARDPLGNTALIMAVNGGHAALAHLLFDAGVEPALHEAAAIGDVARVRAWLERHPRDLDADSPEGFTALALAAHFGQIAVMQLLIERGADVNRIATHPVGVTPLHAALFGRQADAARLLVERGADVTLARGGSGGRRAGWTALHYAAGMGVSTLVQPLLDWGRRSSVRRRTREDTARPCDPGESSRHCRPTPITRCPMTTTILLMMVMAMPQTEPVSEILQAKYRGNHARVEELLKRGPVLNIFEASATGQTARVRELLAVNPALVNTYAPDGFHPLGLATFFGNKSTVEALLEAGADVNQQSRERLKASALYSSAAARRPDIAELLLAKGANPNLRAEAGFTVVHSAAISGQLDLVTLLLRHGADMNVQDTAGKTPLAHAVERKQDAMVAWLRSHGAK